MLKRAWLKKTILLFLASLLLLSHPSRSAETTQVLPESTIHPLPMQLKKVGNNEGDYFSQIKPTSVGYLIWSNFPVKIYLDLALPSPDDNSAEAQRLRTWFTQASLAITDWSQYLPLLVINQEDQADILIKREYPPLGGQINPQTGLRDGLRARSGQTTYQLYLSGDKTTGVLRHRMTIRISPVLSQDALLACLKHELGHGLGIWGHSPLQGDLLYAQQSQQARFISSRDLNTLKRIYQQPTKLGWTVP